MVQYWVKVNSQGPVEGSGVQGSRAIETLCNLSRSAVSVAREKGFIHFANGEIYVLVSKDYSLSVDDANKFFDIAFPLDERLSLRSIPHGVEHQVFYSSKYAHSACPTLAAACEARYLLPKCFFRGSKDNAAWAFSPQSEFHGSMLTWQSDGIGPGSAFQKKLRMGLVNFSNSGESNHMVVKANAKIAASNKALLSSRDQPLVIEADVVVGDDDDSVDGKLAAEMMAINDIGDEAVAFDSYFGNTDSVSTSDEQTYLANPTQYYVFPIPGGGAAGGGTLVGIHRSMPPIGDGAMPVLGGGGGGGDDGAMEPAEKKAKTTLRLRKKVRYEDDASLSGSNGEDGDKSKAKKGGSGMEMETQDAAVLRRASELVAPLREKLLLLKSERGYDESEILSFW